MSPTSRYQAYQAANQTVSKTRQIVMLYDGMIRFLRQTCEAMQEQRIEERYQLLVKVSNIVVGLQGCLDFEQSHEVATSLYDYYNSVDGRIMALHRSNSVEDCQALIDDLKVMRDLWKNIDEEEKAAVSPQQSDIVDPVQPAEQAMAVTHEQSATSVSPKSMAPQMEGTSSIFVSA